MSRSKISIVAAFVFCLSLVLSCCSSAAAAPVYPKFVKIGTGFPGGIWYPASAVLASKLEAALKKAGINAPCSVQSTGGAFNVSAVHEGKEMVLTLTTAQNQYLAYKGMAPYEKPLTNLRVVGTQELMLAQLIVPEKSDIKNISQLKNKKVNGGKLASTDRMMIEALFKAYGMSFNDIKAAGGEVMALGWDDASTMMQDGHMDFIGTYGGLMPSIVNLIVQPGVKFLSIDDAHADKVLADPPMTGYVKATMQPNTYDRQNYPVKTIAIPTTIVCNADLPEDFVYIVTKTIYESGYHKDSFKATEARGWPKICNPQDLPKVANIPLHPGALKYLKEKGIKVK